jgi:hypothetical protein
MQLSLENFRLPSECWKLTLLKEVELDSEDPPAPTDPDIPGPDVQMEQLKGSPPEFNKKTLFKDVT